MRRVYRQTRDLIQAEADRSRFSLKKGRGERRGEESVMNEKLFVIR